MKIFDNNNHINKWEDFKKQLSTRKVGKGEILLMEGEVAENIFIIKSGVIKTYSLDRQGDEHPVSLDIAKEVFPIGLALGLIEKTQYIYQAFIDSELHVISKDEFIRFIKENPEIGYEFYESLANRFIGLQCRVHALEQKLSKDKLMRTLLYFGERFGTSVNKDKKKIEIPFTHQEISNFVGLTRETVSIELKKLEKQGLIKQKNKLYTVNMVKLEQACENN